ncbi:MAG: 2-hydroxyacid dehydrogenase [Candidatus Hodarchaeales archaeon]
MTAKKEKILITRELPGEGIQGLKERFVIDMNCDDRALSREEIITRINGVEYLVPLLSDTIDRAIIESAPKLKLIANYAVGYNNIDLKAAAERGIFVSNTPGVLTAATADIAMALLLAVARRIPESDTFCRDDKFKGWAPLLLLGKELNGKTLGVCGMGRIGEAFTRRAAAFGLKIVYFNRSPKPQLEKELALRKVDLEEHCRISDFISLHLPLTEETEHLIGRNEFNMMKEGAVIINTSRGKIIDETELIKALKSGHLGGAGLDVFYHEPAIPADLKLTNVVLTPHTGSATYETRVAMAKIVSKNIIACSEGKKVPINIL